MKIFFKNVLIKMGKQKKKRKKEEEKTEITCHTYCLPSCARVPLTSSIGMGAIRVPDFRLNKLLTI